MEALIGFLVGGVGGMVGMYFIIKNNIFIVNKDLKVILEEVKDKASAQAKAKIDKILK